MDVLGVVYMQYWLKSSCEMTFLVHMAILKGFYYQPKKLGSTQTWIPTILDVSILDLRFFFFKITMMSNVQWAMNQSMDLNLVFRLWKKLSSNVLLCVRLSKLMKVAKLVVVQIMDSMEDESIFSTLTFMKTRLHKVVYVNIWIWWFGCLHNLFI
jgi:hypothetical protein